MADASDAGAGREVERGLQELRAALDRLEAERAEIGGELSGLRADLARARRALM
jgi:predicted  nucleic acid-binding Zn-ribbon protein